MALIDQLLAGAQEPCTAGWANPTPPHPRHCRCGGTGLQLTDSGRKLLGFVAANLGVKPIGLGGGLGIMNHGKREAT